MYQARSPLYMEIANEFKRRISEGLYLAGQQLPSEPELANELGVSRGTLREALSILEKEGILSRRHGVGSFLKKEPKKVIAGMEKLDSLFSTIQNAGKKAEDKIVKIYQERLDPIIAAALELDPSSHAYVVESLRLADGEPVVYCYDVIPLWLLTNESLLKGRSRCHSLTEFIRMFTPYKPKQFISRVNAVLPPKAVAKLLGVDALTPMIFIEGVLYDENDKAINFGRQYYRGDKYEFTLVRK
ncbi:MAG: GntR family transcriptional regulator [Syntrophomonadaceae bacterium]|nr:GntR family transcriptional regulator [Syntrophomonadaceae bacterium]